MRLQILFYILITVSLPIVGKAQLKYPYPVKSISLTLDGQDVKMVYMDLQPKSPNGEALILFHGKNFTGFYWKGVMDFFANAGYRVIVPDEVGWGLSSKPDMKYSFEMLASNNRVLLDSLHIDKINVLGHSMGGMLAARFAIMFPERTKSLILEDPLGLEDYKKFVPFRSIEQQYKKELSGSYASYKKYQQGYYPQWKPEYEIYVKAQAEPLKQKDFNSVAYVNASTYQMIYEGAVVYDLNKISAPTLLLVGQLDRTILGKDLLKPSQQKLHGNFPVLAGKARLLIKNARLIVIPGVGHIPHIQVPELFCKDVMAFLNSGAKG